MTIDQAYEKLGLDKTASLNDVKSKYRALSKMCHPDMNNDMDQILKAAMDDEFIMLQKAYDQISNVAKPGGKAKPVETEDPVHTKETDFVKVAQTNYKRGIFAYKQGDYSLALQLFQASQRLDPKNKDYDRGIIRCLLTKNRRTHEAKELCVDLVKQESYNPENYYLMGKIYEQAKIPAQALHFYNKARSHGFDEYLVNAAIKEVEITESNNKGIFSKIFKSR